MEPSHAERARTLVHLGRTGALSTQSSKHPGWPFGSVMPYSPDAAGSPLFLISSMAVHTRNLSADARASLLVVQPDLPEDLLAGPRVTILGAVERVPEARVEAARADYLARHAAAAAWVDFQDFAFHALIPTAVYFVGGFGAMGWIAVEDYASAEPDPLADSAVELMYQANLHYMPSIAKLAGSLSGRQADSARIAAVDRLGFQVLFRSAEVSHEIRVPFPHEVRNEEGARKALMELIRPGSGR